MDIKILDNVPLTTQETKKVKLHLSNCLFNLYHVAAMYEEKNLDIHNSIAGEIIALEFLYNSL